MTLQTLERPVQYQAGTSASDGLNYSGVSASTGATERIKTYGQLWDTCRKDFDLQGQLKVVTIICKSFGESVLTSENCVLVGESLVDGWIRAIFGGARGTTLPQTVWVECKGNRVALHVERDVKPRSQTTAKDLLDEIQVWSRLTLEEIAPLLGVSRRALQNWRASEPISARKEQRLRDLRDFLASLKMSDAEKMRLSLLNRREHGLRAYDALAERQFGLAYEMVTGKAAPAESNLQKRLPQIPAATSLLARLSVRESQLPGSGGEINRRRSGRLKR